LYWQRCGAATGSGLFGQIFLNAKSAKMAKQRIFLFFRFSWRSWLPWRYWRLNLDCDAHAAPGRFICRIFLEWGAMSESASETKTPALETVEPVGPRVLIRKDQDKKRTKSGIHLPDKIEIPTLTGRVVSISAEVASNSNWA